LFEHCFQPKDAIWRVGHSLILFVLWWSLIGQDWDRGGRRKNAMAELLDRSACGAGKDGPA
jgi:hypothetical protein